MQRPVKQPALRLAGSEVVVSMMIWHQQLDSVARLPIWPDPSLAESFRDHSECPAEISSGSPDDDQ